MKISGLVALLFALPVPAFTQISNESFEEWRIEKGREHPAGWTGSSFGMGRDSSGHEGRYAVSVWNWYFGALGSVTVGEFDLYNFGMNDAGVPLDFLPAKLTGYYRYELGQNSMEGEKIDSAAVHVTLLRYNPALPDPDTISFVEYLLPPSSEWIPFEIELPIRMTGLRPDTAVITFYSSSPTGSAFCVSEDGTCCYLSIDDVALVATSGVPYRLDDIPSPVRVVPNPVMNASALLQFDGEDGKRYRLTIHDASGRLALEREAIGSEIDLSGLDLPAGSYYASILDAANVPVAGGKFVAE